MEIAAKTTGTIITPDSTETTIITGTRIGIKPVMIDTDIIMIVTEGIIAITGMRHMGISTITTRVADVCI
jgi:metal-dependent hydrolase (beta-lactamase superfamily II)